MDDTLDEAESSSATQSLRPFVVVAASMACLAVTLALCTDPLLALRHQLESGRSWSTLPLDALLTSLAAVVLACCGLWLATVTVATALEALTGASHALVRAVSPGVVRRVVLASCGLAVGGAGIWSPASAVPIGEVDEVRVATPVAATTPVASAARVGSIGLTGLPLPDRVLGVAPPSEMPAGAGPRVPLKPRSSIRHVAATQEVVPVAAAGRQLATYVVREGDSLWSLAARLLPTPRAAEVGRAWPRIHRLNRSAIGPDPDLIIPGTTLRLPGDLNAPQRAHSGNPAYHREDTS
ncbi:MAG TPA: LysM domain-containing protein [Nocardioidaceae bacterium]|nr:LysM domain-containing protein [Nocardioidaceae bacterium]